MKHASKVLFNTIASFSRVVINAVVTLVATRIALRVLGAEDFGLYNLLAGTVMLLSFVNGALMVSAQRFFSISIGEKNHEKLNRYYNSSLSIHILLGVVIVAILLALRPILFGGFLNITDKQVEIGIVIYNIMVVSSAITIMTIPYSAIMNAYEDMVMMAIADILACFIKLAAAVVLLYVEHDLLLIYSLVMLGAAAIKAFVEFIWSKIKYPVVREHLQYLIDFKCMKEMLGFVGWNTLGSTAVVVRNQGIAVVLNVFFGTIINTAYGIANQVNSLVLAFASTLTTVFSPIIISAKGEGREDRMREIAVFSSKLSFLLSSMLAIPILVFLTEILEIWLGNYPDNTFVFCYLVVLSFLVLQLYPGINRAIYASGKIKGYQIAISVILVSILPIGILLLKLGLPAYMIIVTMLLSQIGTLIATIVFGVKHCGFSSKTLYLNTVLRPVIVFICAIVIFSMIYRIVDFGMLFELTFKGCVLVLIASVVIDLFYLPAYYFVVLDNNEKSLLKKLFTSFLKKKG